jgi:hypothetical protein
MSLATVTEPLDAATWLCGDSIVMDEEHSDWTEAYLTWTTTLSCGC